MGWFIYLVADLINFSHSTFRTTSIHHNRNCLFRVITMQTLLKSTSAFRIQTSKYISLMYPKFQRVFFFALEIPSFKLSGSIHLERRQQCYETIYSSSSPRPPHLTSSANEINILISFRRAGGIYARYLFRTWRVHLDRTTNNNDKNFTNFVSLCRYIYIVVYKRRLYIYSR